LKIPAFKDCHTLSAGQDTELLKVADYLVRIATLPDRDFRKVDHKVNAEPWSFDRRLIIIQQHWKNPPDP
jgi:hypothetical protein